MNTHLTREQIWLTQQDIPENIQIKSLIIIVSWLLFFSDLVEIITEQGVGSYGMLEATIINYKKVDCLTHGQVASSFCS